jgi:cytochrome c oxidase subunit 4
MSRTPHTFTGGSHHIMPKKIYFIIFAALLVGTAATVQAAFIDLGALVVLFFMHVKYSSRLTKLVVTSGLVWLIILFGLTMEDYLSRKWIPNPASWETQESLETPASEAAPTPAPAHDVSR